MKNAMKNSTRSLLILKYLLEQTDESHTITIAEINNLLTKQNLSGDRKTIRECIAELQTVGYDIKCIRKTQNHYYINKRDFSLAEVKLLVDAVQSSTTGWNRIKIPNNLQSQGTHNTLIVGAVPCGQPTPAIEDIEAAVALPDAIFGCADHVILRAKGPSMIKRGIFNEDLLVVSRQETAEYGETVIALLEDGDSTCKILAKKSNGKPYLKAANDETDKNGRRVYDVYPKGDWRIYGVVDYVIHAPVREEF